MGLLFQDLINDVVEVVYLHMSEMPLVHILELFSAGTIIIMYIMPRQYCA